MIVENENDNISCFTHLYSYDKRDDKFFIIYKLYKKLNIFVFNYYYRDSIVFDEIKEIIKKIKYMNIKRNILIKDTFDSENNDYCDITFDDNYNYYRQDEKIVQDKIIFKIYLEEHDIVLDKLNTIDLNALIYAINNRFQKK